MRDGCAGSPRPRRWVIRRRMFCLLLGYLAGWVVLAVLACRLVLG
ncbi:MAG: hypothetical protein QM581_13805 [Pseudomonas sp.]